MNQLNVNKPDLSSCDKEPVQFIGSIQPFGFLLVADEVEMKVQQASQNISDALGRDLSKILGFPLSEVFQASLIQSLKSGQTMIRFEKWNVAVQRNAGQMILEFEPLSSQKASSSSGLHLMTPLVGHLQAATSIMELCSTAAEQLQKFTGFDRVMIYRFHDDLHGEVVAETTRPGVDSYLGLHYPASDIPAPARAVFQKNWLRMIPDVEAVPVPILSANPIAVNSLDLTKCTLRSVSPIHLEYLKNMGVGASLTVSILIDGKLWGLIACHHLVPKFVCLEEREVYELIGRLLSALIYANESLKLTRERERRKTVLDILVSQMVQTDDLGEALVTRSINLTNLISSEGVAAAMYIEGRWVTSGNVPRPEQLDELTSWLVAHQSLNGVFYTSALSTLYPSALAFADVGSGLLAISIPKSSKTFAMCFRPELIRTITWSGNPDKPVDSKSGDFRVHPRKSFEAWAQTVTRQSEPWKPWEIDAALELRDSIMAIDLQRQFNNAQRADAEIKARADVMSVLSHDLKNPIASIRLNLGLIPKVAPADSLMRIAGMLDSIQRSTEIMMQMITDILDVTRIEAGNLNLKKDQVEAEGVINETVEMLRPMAADKNINVTKVFPKEECRVSCDRGRLFQVLANLLSNAIKFTPLGGNVTICVERRSLDQFEFRVSDTGTGIPKESLPRVFDRFWQAKEARRFGSGLGLAIARGIIETTGGKIWVESEEGRGSTFYFTLPAVRVLKNAA